MRAMKNYLDREKSGAIVRLYQDGNSTRNVARLVGVGRRTVTLWLRRLGLGPRRWGHEFSEAHRAEIATLYQKRVSMQEIGRRFGASKSTVRSLLRKMGVLATFGGREHARTIKATEKHTRDSLMWAAGFLEGEGCFVGPEVVVSASQVNPEPTARLLRMFGGGVSTIPGKMGSREQPCTHWRACGARGRGVALTLYPLMSGRRKGQIRRALTGRSDG